MNAPSFLFLDLSLPILSDSISVAGAEISQSVSDSHHAATGGECLIFQTVLLQNPVQETQSICVIVFLY